MFSSTLHAAAAGRHCVCGIPRQQSAAAARGGGARAMMPQERRAAPEAGAAAKGGAWAPRGAAYAQSEEQSGPLRPPGAAPAIERATEQGRRRAARRGKPEPNRAPRGSACIRTRASAREGCGPGRAEGCRRRFARKPRGEAPARGLAPAGTPGVRVGGHCIGCVWPRRPEGGAWARCEPPAQGGRRARQGARSGRGFAGAGAARAARAAASVVFLGPPSAGLLAWLPALPALRCSSGPAGAGPGRRGLPARPARRRAGLRGRRASGLVRCTLAGHAGAGRGGGIARAAGGGVQFGSD